jgi:predicted PurR-regulated permease PerM
VAGGGVSSKSAANPPLGPAVVAPNAPATPLRPAAVPLIERGNRLVGIALVTLASIAAIWFLSWGKGILIPLSFALFLAICLTPSVHWLSRWGVPCALGAAVVMLVLSGLLGVLVDRTRGDLMQLLDEVPPATRFLRHEVERNMSEPGSLGHRLKALVDLPQATSPKAAGSAARAATAAPAAPVPSVAEGTLQVVSFTGELAAVLFLVFLLLSASGRVQPERAADSDQPAPSPTAISSFMQLTKAMHLYLGVVVLTNAALGAAVWGLFHLLGVDRAAAWGLVVALLHFVPYVGAAAFTVGSTLLASIQFHSLAHGLLVGGSGLVLSALIGVVLQTWLSGRSVRMNTVAVFVSLMVWGWLWGLPGLLLATPLTVSLKVACRNFADLHWLAALLDQRGAEDEPPLAARVLQAVGQRVGRLR